jgi:hypothetical protein
MIELERDESQDTQVWADEDFSHVIVEETGNTWRYGSDGPGWYVRDEDGEAGPFALFADALDAAHDRGWPVTLAPANRLVRDIKQGRSHAIADYLLGYLAEYGPVGIDVQALANLVMTLAEEN